MERVRQTLSNLSIQPANFVSTTGTLALMTQADIAARVERLTKLSAGFGREIELLRKQRLDPFTASRCAGLLCSNPGRPGRG